MTDREFNQIVLISADSVEQLRRQDVWRVLDAADEQGLRADFSDWLRGQRPDLTAEITAYTEEAAA